MGADPTTAAHRRMAEADARLRAWKTEHDYYRVVYGAPCDYAVPTNHGPAAWTDEERDALDRLQHAFVAAAEEYEALRAGAAPPA